MVKKHIRSRLAKRIVCTFLAVTMAVSGSVFAPQVFDGQDGKTGTVCAEAATVKLNYSSCRLDRGQRQNLYVNGTSQTVRWSSSNKSVATVDAYGCVTGIKRGTTYVTAKLGNGRSYRCKVVVSGRIHIRKSSEMLSDGRRIYMREKYDNNWNYTNWLYSYNPATGRKVKLTNLRCMSLDDIRGGYLYITAHVSANSSTDYIYRVSKDGRSKKCLGQGSGAKIIGNYIYYTYYSYNNQYGTDKGVYRMKLDGTGKTLICYGSYELCVANNLLVGIKRDFGSDGPTEDTYLIYNSGIAKKTYISSTCSVNWWKNPYDEIERYANVCNNAYGYTYTQNGLKCGLVRKSSGVSRVVKTFSFRISKIYDAGEYLIVEGCGTYGVKMVVVSKSGKSMRTLYSRAADRQYIP